MAIGWFVALALLVSLACGGAGQVVKPEEMSAAQHRKEAAREIQAAERQERAYDPVAETKPMQDGPDGDEVEYLFSIPVYDPNDEHLVASRAHLEHARQHEQAARSLERFEEAECRKFPPASRAACPLLGPVTKIEDIAGGVRARFSPGVRVDAVFAHMRCHYAYARARGFDQAAGCPLYLKGIVISSTDPAAVEIASTDPATAAQIRFRSRAEAVFVKDPAAVSKKSP